MDALFPYREAFRSGEALRLASSSFSPRARESIAKLCAKLMPYGASTAA
jgi:hypothetical protein